VAGSLPLKNDVQLVTQFPQSRRQALDVLSAAEAGFMVRNALKSFSFLAGAVPRR